ncbi:hypothetical protein MDA_GLEAN10017728 [Myotis davidii]|uniref:Uncharacterized protein n=1 Tax=Myotis davidii TaxID=225400 RepID=L5LI35_MYODS|nr:hypothetical protein MDA_GLEAN10017728 [Myotis davidii]
MSWQAALGPARHVKGHLGLGESLPQPQPLLVQLLHMGAGLRKPHQDGSIDAFHLPQQCPVCTTIIHLGLAPDA